MATPDSRGNRMFSEQEAGDIMKRAAQLQEGAAGDVYQPGVTRDELRRVAQEMGVGDEYLDQAILERLSNRPRGLVPTLQMEERVVEGELDPRDFDIVLQNVSVRSNRRSAPVQIGRSLTAQAWSGTGLVKLQVSSRNGRTRIQVRPRPVLELIGSFYGAFLVAMIGGGRLSELGMPAIAFALSAIAFFAAFLVARAWVFASQRKAAELADHLQKVIGEHLAQSQTTVPSTTVNSEEALDRVRLGQ